MRAPPADVARKFGTPLGPRRWKGVAMEGEAVVQRQRE